MSCQVQGDLVAPHFVFDPDQSTVMVDVPKNVSVWEIYDAVQSSHGLASVAWSVPRPSVAMTRTFRARFNSAGAARGAAAALPEHLAKPESKSIRATLLTPSPELTAFVLPADMSKPERIQKDLILSRKAIELLDGLLGVSPSATKALLDFEGEDETKLDLQVMYLRRVHHFCFYSGHWCKDEWELRDKTGAVAILRSACVEQENRSSDWEVDHEKRISSFFQTAKFERPTIPSGDDEAIQTRFADIAQEQTLKVSDQKFQCRVCQKAFRGANFVEKHVRKMHTEFFEAVREAALNEAARKAYMADPSELTFCV